MKDLLWKNITNFIATNFLLRNVEIDCKQRENHLKHDKALLPALD